MRIILYVLLTMLSGCVSASEQELKTKVDACTSAGMDYSYLRDFKGQPYDVMCVAKRIR